MRILAWTFLMLGLTAFTMGCTQDTVEPVETDGTPAATEADHGEEGHVHEEGDEHMHEGETDPAAEVPAAETPAPEAETPPAVVEEPVEGEVPEPELDLNLEN